MSRHREKIQIVVVSEDRVQEVLLRRYLTQVGYHPRKVRYLTAPSGRGSGEQFVRLRYAVELALYRTRTPEYWRLVAVMDADAGTVAQHEAELSAVAVASGQSPRSPAEGVVHLIPKRNVETWIHALFGQPADETTDYKSLYNKQPENQYCRPAADALAALVRDANQQSVLPSLRLGVTELRDKLSGQ